MATQVGVGSSNHRNPAQAAKDAAAAAMKQAGISAADFVMMFATTGYDQKTILKEVRAATGNAPLSGCSGEGVIAQGGIGNESPTGVSVMVWKSDTIKFRNARATGLKNDPVGAAKAIAGELGDMKGGQALFVFADGLTFNFDKFEEGFRSAAKADKPIKLIGGTAGDANMAFKQTFQYHNDDVFSDGVCGVLLTGGATIAVDVTHGAHPIGVEHTVTKAEGNQIFEIDGKPALSVLYEHLSEEDTKQFNLKGMMVNIGLGFKAPKDVAEYQQDENVLRVVAAKDDAKKSISIYTEVKPGAKFFIIRRDTEKMMSGVDALADRVSKKLGGKTPAAVLQFECAGRGKHLWREEEKLGLINKLQGKLGANVPWAGFYCLGEIGPVGSQNHFHNYTTVLAAIA